jgi:Na+-translocating ferredoxin:NAD+ oxidoreductase RnfC subunit
MKHSKADINGRVLSRTADGLNRYGYSPICGITNSLSEATNNGKYKWAVRINTLKRWMRIGICQIRHAQ